MYTRNKQKRKILLGISGGIASAIIFVAVIAILITISLEELVVADFFILIMLLSVLLLVLGINQIIILYLLTLKGE